jgi:hypothetical protein
MAITTIQVTPETRDMLKSVGRKGETYDAIVRKLLKSSEYVAFIEEQYRILREEGHWAKLTDLP